MVDYVMIRQFLKIKALRFYIQPFVHIEEIKKTYTIVLKTNSVQENQRLEIEKSVSEQYFVYDFSVLNKLDMEKKSCLIIRDKFFRP